MTCPDVSSREAAARNRRFVAWFDLLVGCRNALHGAAPARTTTSPQGAQVTTHLLGWAGEPGQPGGDLIRVELDPSGSAYGCLVHAGEEMDWKWSPAWETTLHGARDLAGAMVEVDAMFRERGLLPLEACALADRIVLSGLGARLMTCDTRGVDAFIRSAADVDPSIGEAARRADRAVAEGASRYLPSRPEAERYWAAMVESLLQADTAKAPVLAA